MRAANGAGLAANQVGETLRIAVVEVEPGNPRYPYKPPIPLTVVVNPVIEPSTTRWSRSTRAACRCPTCAATVTALRQRPRALPRPRRRRARRGQARADGRHVPARVRPPRRRAVPRPRAATRRRSRPGSSSSASTATTFVERDHASSWSGSARDAATGASWPGSAATRAEPGVLHRGRRATGSRRSTPRRAPPGDADAARRPHAARARQRPLARVPPRAARAHARGRRARSGPGASRCTRSPATLDPDSLPRARARDVRRDGAGRDHVRRRVPLPPPRARRHALRRPERDGRGADRRGARTAGLRITLLDACYLHGGDRALPRRATRATRGPSAVDALAERGAGARSAPRSTASARSTRTPRAVVAEWAASAARRCTPTSPSSRPRTRRASPRTAARRPRCSPTPARSARASPRSTPRT